MIPATQIDLMPDEMYQVTLNDGTLILYNETRAIALITTEGEAYILRRYPYISLVTAWLRCQDIKDWEVNKLSVLRLKKFVTTEGEEMTTTTDGRKHGRYFVTPETIQKRRESRIRNKSEFQKDLERWANDEVLNGLVRARFSLFKKGQSIASVDKLIKERLGQLKKDHPQA